MNNNNNQFFKKSKCLTNCEVLWILNNNLNGIINNNVLNETLKYVKEFVYHKNEKETIFALRRKLSKMNLTELEIALICNLFPDNIEECVAIIPTLVRLKSQEITKIIDIIKIYKDDQIFE